MYSPKREKRGYLGIIKFLVNPQPFHVTKDNIVGTEKLLGIQSQSHVTK